MAKLISVTGVTGRIAYSEAVGGREIPHDRYITLPESAWLAARAAAGDIEIQRSTQDKPSRGRKKRNVPDVVPYETTEANPETIETA